MLIVASTPRLDRELRGLARRRGAVRGGGRPDARAAARLPAEIVAVLAGLEPPCTTSMYSRWRRVRGRSRVFASASRRCSLAFAQRKPLIGVSALDALADVARRRRPLKGDRNMGGRLARRGMRRPIVSANLRSHRSSHGRPICCASWARVARCLSAMVPPPIAISSLRRSVPDARVADPPRPRWRGRSPGWPLRRTPRAIVRGRTRFGPST